MWIPHEREELAVWADDLQRRGDAWGELVATSLALETLESEHDPEHATRLRARLLALEAEVLRPRVDPLFAGQPGIQAHWQHGALVALRVCPARAPSRVALDRVAALLRLPAARFLWLLHVDLWSSQSTALHVEVPAMLLDPEVTARPRIVMLGSPPRHVRRRRPLAAIPEPGRAIAEPERGLESLFLDSARIELPWARGDRRARVRAFEALAARVLAADARPTPLDRTTLARALWDRSLHVRLAALDLVAELGDEAASLVPELALITRGAPEWVDRARELLSRLAGRPEIVARVAEEFVIEQAGVTRWLGAIGSLGGSTRARIDVMIRDAVGQPGWVVRELQHALR
ncbi:hypothetical protein ACNOYE_38370 [Nannocystaceae bacterium ST9]